MGRGIESGFWKARVPVADVTPVMLVALDSGYSSANSIP